MCNNASFHVLMMACEKLRPNEANIFPSIEKKNTSRAAPYSFVFHILSPRVALPFAKPSKLVAYAWNMKMKKQFFLVITSVGFICTLFLLNLHMERHFSRIERPWFITELSAPAGIQCYDEPSTEDSFPDLDASRGRYRACIYKLPTLNSSVTDNGQSCTLQSRS